MRRSRIHCGEGFGGFSECARQIVQIRQVLVSPAGPLVQFEMPKTDDIDFDPVEGIRNTLSVALVEVHTRNPGRDLDSHGRVAHPHNVLVFEEQAGIQLQGIKPKARSTVTMRCALVGLRAIQMSMSLVARG